MHSQNALLSAPARPSGGGRPSRFIFRQPEGS